MHDGTYAPPKGVTKASIDKAKVTGGTEFCRIFRAAVKRRNGNENGARNLIWTSIRPKKKAGVQEKPAPNETCVSSTSVPTADSEPSAKVYNFYGGTFNGFHFS